MFAHFNAYKNECCLKGSRNCCFHSIHCIKLNEKEVSQTFETVLMMFFEYAQTGEYQRNECLTHTNRKRSSIQGQKSENDTQIFFLVCRFYKRNVYMCNMWIGY